MNAAIVQRLVWKEYRVLRAFWLATILLAACAAIVWRSLASWYERPVQLEDFFVIAAVMTSLFALGAGGTAFSTEHEIGTSDFLRRLPLDAKHLLAGKLLLSAAGLWALKIVLWASIAVFFVWFPVSSERLRTIWWCGVVSELELFAWGMLFSLLTRQPLMAITWGIVTATAVVHLLPVLLGVPESSSQRNLLDDYTRFMPGRALFALALLATAGSLSTKWIHSQQPVSLIPEWLIQRAQRMGASRQTGLGATSASLTTATARAQLLRIIWLQWRQSRLLWVSLAIPFILSGILKLTAAFPADIGSLLVMGSSLLLWLGLGISVFHAQQAQCRFRYFAEHGITPSRIWWGHQLAVLPPMIVSMALLSVGIVLNDPYERLGVPLIVAVLAFSVAQLAGMLFRQSLVGGAIGFVFLLVHFGWLMFLGYLVNPSTTEVRWALVGCLPLLLAWFLATRLRTSDWILERRTGAARLRLALCLILPWMLMATGLMSYRVLEIPDVAVEPPTREQLLSLTPEEHETAMVYEAAVEMLTTNVNGMPAGWWSTDSRFKHELWMKPFEARVYEVEQPFVSSIRAATDRSVGAFAGEPDRQNDDAYLLLTALKLIKARAEAAGEVATFIKLDKDMRQLIRHWRRNTDLRGLSMSNGFEWHLDSDLQKLLQKVSLKPDEYRELSQRVTQLPGPLSVARAIDWAYREALDEPRNERQLQPRDGFIYGYHNEGAPSKWWLSIPGEKARTARLIRANYVANRSSPHFAHGAYSPGLQGYEFNSPWARWLMLRTRLQSHDTSQISPVVAQEVLQALLELHARKAELGHWPETKSGIPGLGIVGRVTIDYLPHGLWGGTAPHHLAVRTPDQQWIKLRGDEPCLVWAYRGHKLPDDLVNAPTENDLKDRLQDLLVVPLDPLPESK